MKLSKRNQQTSFKKNILDVSLNVYQDIEIIAQDSVVFHGDNY